MAVNLNEMLGVRVAPDMSVAPATPEGEAVEAAQAGVQETFENETVVFAANGCGPATAPRVEKAPAM